MKSILLKSTVAAFAALALCAPISSIAQTAPAAATPAAKAGKGDAKAEAVKKTPYQGELTAIDGGGANVTVKLKSESLTLVINAETKILVDKKPAKLTDFAVGDKVTGSYEKTGETTTAASLHKKTAAAAPKAK